MLWLLFILFNSNDCSTYCKYHYPKLLSNMFIYVYLSEKTQHNQNSHLSISEVFGMRLNVTFSVDTLIIITTLI